MKTPSEIYAMLIDVCGAPEKYCANFVDYLNEKHDRYEYRFQGLLGFGGKFYRDRFSGDYIDCYREDSTPERRAMIAKANLWLKEQPR